MNRNPVIERAMEHVKQERGRIGREMEKLDQALAELSSIGRRAMPHLVRHARRRGMTAAGRRAISLAQKARWAKVRKNKLAA